MDTPNKPPFHLAWYDLSGRQRDAVAAMCGVSVGHLRNVAQGAKRVRPIYAIAVERASAGFHRAEQVMPEQEWERVRDKDWPVKDGRPQPKAKESPYALRPV